MSEVMKLKNGIRVHLIPYEGTKAATVLVQCKVGSRYEYEEINGAAHYIEHLMFKGTKRRPSTLDISRTLDAVGAEFNAYTGKNITGYYIKIDGTHVPLAIDLLNDMLFHSLYDQEEMDRERGVIIEEINMYEDNPMMHVEDLLEQAMFEGSTLGWEIAGSRETMRNMTRDQVIAFRDSHYVPERLVIVVAGNITDETKEWLEESFGQVPESKEPPKDFEEFSGIESSDVPRVRVQEKPTQQVQLAMGMPSFGVKDDRNRALDLMSVILGGTMSSRLFISVRERKGLAYFVRSSNSAYDEVGNFMIRAGLDKTRLPMAVKTILEEMQKLVEEGVTEDELREAKDHIRGKILLKLEDSSNRAEWFARQELFLDKVETPEERMAEYDKITAEDIQAVAKEVLDPSRLSVAAIGPYKDGDAFLEAAGLK